MVYQSRIKMPREGLRSSWYSCVSAASTLSLRPTTRRRSRLAILTSVETTEPVAAQQPFTFSDATQRHVTGDRQDDRSLSRDGSMVSRALSASRSI